MMKALTLLLLAMAQANAQVGVPTDTYQQTCELPAFEWAAYGTRLTGRMYTRRAALLGDSLFAAGYLKSTNAPNLEGFVDVDDDFGVTGPYTAADPTGTNASFVTSDLISYTTEYGSFAQYEVGVVKIDRTTGIPQDVYVYYGEGQDETTGLAAKEIASGEKILAISEGGADYVVHPNAITNGFDDGFIISADAETGKANWIVAHPKSTKDAETVGIDVDAEGNIYGAGYACNQPEDDLEAAAICHGFVAKFAALDGAIVWENIFTDLGAAMWLVYDEADESLYITGTTTYKGDGSDAKENEYCSSDVCAVTMRLSATNGDVDWVRTVEGSPRWNLFDQTGDIRLAEAQDGPYIYVALDNAGENGKVTLDGGTPYVGCFDSAGQMTPEYLIDPSKVVTADDCAVGSVFVSRESQNAFPAFNATTGASCGTGHDAADACIMKYHKFTGLPVWGTDMPPVASLVPSPDGLSVMAIGFYYPSWGHFDSVVLPDYNGVEGAYNAKLNAETGKGEYVMHSGGVSKDRPYDAVSSPEGDVYIVGYTQSAVIDWGGTLVTKIIEEGEDQNDDAGTAFQFGKVSSSTSEYQFFAVKLAASEVAPTRSCVESCTMTGPIAAHVIKAGTCLIDNICYVAGATAELFGRPCLVCDPEQSSSDWSFGPTLGLLECFIDNTCREDGEFLTFRANRTTTITSLCQVCSAESNVTGWSVAPGNFLLVPNENPPDDCVVETVGTGAPIEATTTAPATATTSAPVGATTNAPIVTASVAPIAPIPVPVPPTMPPFLNPTNAPAPTTVPAAPRTAAPADLLTETSAFGAIEGGTLSTGAIVGIVLGSLACVGVI